MLQTYDTVETGGILSKKNAIVKQTNVNEWS